MDWMRLPDRPRAVCLAAVIAIALLATLPATALATFGISGFIAAPDDPTAGAHSDFTIHFAVDDPGNNLKAFVVHLPPGQTGDPSATARCTQDEFAAGG